MTDCLRPVSFAENKSKETILHENIIELMDSLQSSSFDSLFLNLKTEVINANSDELYIELLKLKVYEYYLNGNTDSLYFYTEILKNKAMYVSDMESYYKAWGYTINHYSLTGRIYKAISESENMLAEASALHNIYGMALSRQYLGEIYLYMELYDESISQLRKSFDYAQKAGFSPKRSEERREGKE